jgi:hypothetical protein
LPFVEGGWLGRATAKGDAIAGSWMELGDGMDESGPVET